MFRMPTPLTPAEISAFNSLPDHRQARIRSLLAPPRGVLPGPLSEAARYVQARLRFVNGSLGVGEVYADYAAWSPRPMSKRQLSRSLLTLGVRQNPSRSYGRLWDGVGWAA